MKRTRKTLHVFKVFFVISFAAALVAACGSAPKSTSAPTAPTTAPAQPTPTRAPAPASPTPAAPMHAPTAAPAPTKTAASANQTAPAAYDGDWQGTASSADMSISFTIENNQITFANLAYALNSGGCSLSGSLSQTVKGTIDGKKFTIQIKDDDGKKYSFAGTFVSSAEANGTLELKGTSQVRGAFDAKATWTAKNSPTGSSDTSSVSPTAAPVSQGSNSSTVPGMTDSDVLLTFFKATNTKNLDAALALVDDQIVFNINSNSGIGKDDLRTFLQSQTSRNLTYTASNLKGADGVLSFTLQASDKSSSVDGDTATIDDGKIQTLVLH